ncbi:MAG: hypothetical protein AAGI15_02660 [Pseudomonadota bacterium]
MRPSLQRLACALVLALPLVVGCASQVQTDAQGRHSVTCDLSGTLACHRDARAHCGAAGYRVLSEVSDAGSQAAGADVSLISVRDRVRILTFVCQEPTTAD